MCQLIRIQTKIAILIAYLAKMALVHIWIDKKEQIYERDRMKDKKQKRVNNVGYFPNLLVRPKSH